MMLRLIRFLIFGDGHLHKWRATSQGLFYEMGDEGSCVFAVCEHCGKRRMFKHATIGDWEEK